MAISPISDRVLYSTFTNEIDTHPVSGDLLSIKNEKSVIQSIKNLLFTDEGERLFRPYLGGNLRKLLFENINPQNILVTKERIFNIIRDYEPRADCREVNIFYDETKNSVTINIIISVVNIEQPITFTVILERVR